MASSTKRSWKLQEFTAHEANVNCLALGHKSGRVLVTGGDDKKVNLWAVGKPNCIMSLSGHSTPVEAVQFNYSEELVCAGSQTGAIKIWDLEAAKLVRTLTGHKGGIKTTDFHPYGDFLASGSHDTVIKLWDTRRKGCIFTYRGHRLTVNSLKFSPDGQWIASGGEEGLVKVWDLRMGRVLKEFSEHNNSVSCVEFHPNEFLLASGSSDRTVNFWDLESFQIVSSEKDVGAVRAIAFHPGGECLYSGSSDTLRVLGWEPSRTFDVVPVGWGRVHDIATAQNQLIGASFHMANVLLYVVVIKTLQPFGDSLVPDIRTSSPFTRESVRRSFSREKTIGLSPKSIPQVKTIEESTSGTDQEEETNAEIPNVSDYREVFKPNRSLARTPPPEEPFIEPIESLKTDPTKPQILLPGSHSEPEYLSLSSLEIQSSGSVSLQHQSNSLELQPSTCPAENITIENHASSYPSLPTSTPLYNRSLSNLDTIFKNRNLLSEPIEISKIKSPSCDIDPDISDSPPSSDPIRPPRIKSPSSIPSSPPQKNNIRRQNSCKDVPQNNGFGSGLKHSVSEVNINRTTTQSRSNSFNKGLSNAPTSRKEISNRLTNNRNSSNNSRIPNFTNRSDKQPVRSSHHPPPIDVYVTPRNNVNRTSSYSMKQIETDEKHHDDFVPMPVDKPVGLDFSDFLPKSNSLLGSSQTMSNMSEAEVLGSIMRGHDPMVTVLKSRSRSLQIFYSIWQSKGVKSALESAIAVNDLSVIVDVLGIITLKTSLWSLDICVLILPKIQELLQSRYETYMQIGCNALRLILQNFSSVIKSNVQTPCGSLGVDIPREERYKKCKSCHDNLLSIRAFLLKRQTMQGALGTTFRDLHKLMQILD